MNLLRSGKTLVLLSIISLGLNVFCSPLLWINPVIAEEKTSDEENSSFKKADLRQKKIYERYLSIVTKKPNRGTAFDRVYGYHIEQGTLKQFVETLSNQVKNNPNDANSWVILGLIESQRGNDAQAITAFRKAESTQKDNALISYYLSQSLVLVGQTDKAVLALERAIKKKPAKNDLLNIFKSLGKLHQQANRLDEAMNVWTRLEKLFPDNQRVQEQIAIYLEDDSQYKEALKRYEKLSNGAKDQYQKVVFKVKAAELKLRLGKKEAAIDDFEVLMGQLKPNSWLYRDVRNRIEQIFMRTEDLAGLTQYYKSWIKKQPQDIDAISRLGSTLSKQGRSPEALAQFRQAIKLAPSTVKFRESLIEELIYSKKIDEAIQEYEKLDKVKPNNIEILKEWGLLVLENKSKPIAERQKEVSLIWDQLQKANSKDPVILSQIADWYRQAELKEKAIALYQQTIKLSPESPQYYEYLGEYFHQLKRKDDALKTWKLLIEGENRTPRNLIRLAEVLGGFGYKKEALVFWKEASENDLEFPEFVRYAQLLRENNNIKESLTVLEKALKVAERSEDRQNVVQEQILCYQESQTLKQEITKLQETLKTKKGNQPENWAKLALYYESSNESGKAIKAITSSLKLAKNNVTTLTAAARLYESAGDLKTAVNTYQHLLKTDRKYKTEYLNKIASLQMQLGFTESSLKTARELIAASPGNPEGYQFYADLCFQIGRNEEGIKALRRSVRANPTELSTLHSLASVLADQFQTGEATEIYWRTFDKSDNITDRLDIISKITALYVRRNRSDQLFDRLNRMKNEQKDKREISLCLAQAHQSTGDFGSARKTLENMLTENTKDTQLLQQLISLSEREDNLESAIKFQKRVNEIAPSKEGNLHLAKLQLQTGETTEAEAIWTKILDQENDPAKILKSVDYLISRDKKDLAEIQLDKILYKDPGNWDLKYRKLVLAILNDKKEDAVKISKELATLNQDQQTLSQFQKEQEKRIKKMRKSQSSRYRSYRSTPVFFNRSQATSMIRNLKKRHKSALQNAQQRGGFSSMGFVSYSGGHSSRSQFSRPTFWIPQDFGALKMAVITLLYDDAKSKNKAKEFIQKYKSKIDKPSTTNEEWIDWCYVNLAADDVKNNLVNVVQALSHISKRSSLPDKALYLFALTGSGRTKFNTSPDKRVLKEKKPYPESEVNHIVACYQELLQSKPEWLQTNLLFVVMAELERSGRKDESLKLYKKTIQDAITPQLIQKAIQIAVMQEDGESLFTLIKRYDTINKGSNPYAQQYIHQFMQLLGKAKQKKDTKLLFKLVELSLGTISDQHLNKSRRRSQQSYSFNRSQQQSMHVSIYGANNQNRYIQIDYPFANSQLNQSTVQLLRNCYEGFKAEDSIPQLIKLIEKQLEKSNKNINLKMALVAIYWWNSEKEVATSLLKEVINDHPKNIEIRLEYAQLLFREGDKEDAIAVLDSIEVLDFNILKEKELIALQLAIQSNDVDRAKKAAERLFGLRLNNNTQIQLASVMHQLGMNEMGDAVLARIRRSAGNNVNTLGQLMNRYQQQGKSDIASEIAMQIIRSKNFSSSNRNNSDHYYQSAIRILTQAGHLQKLIEITEKQFKQSPKSNKIMMKLMSYYAATKNKKKIKELQEKMLNTQSGNPKMIYQMARSAASGNNHKYAADLYLIVLQKKPELLANDFYQVTNTFSRAQRSNELMDKLLKMDLKKFRHYHYLTNIINNGNSRDSKINKAKITLLKKVMDSFPDQKLNVIGNIHRQELWNEPGMYELVKTALLSSNKNLKNNPWYGLERIISYSSTGKVNGLSTRLISMAKKQKKEKELITLIEKKIKETPEWLGGKGLLAILYLGNKKQKQAKKIIQELQKDKKRPINNQSRWLIAQELHDDKDLHPIAIELYLENEKNPQNNRQQEFMYRSTRGLLELYVKRDKKEKAIKILSKLEKEPPRQQHNASYTAYSQINRTMHLSKEYTKIGYHHETIRVLTSLIENDSLFTAAANYGGDHYKQRINKDIENSIKSIDGDVIVLILKDQIKKQNSPAKSVKKDEIKKPDNKTKTANNKTIPDSLFPIDFIWIISQGDLTKSRVESTFFNILKKKKITDKQKKEIESLLTQLKKKGDNKNTTSLTDLLISSYMNKKIQSLDKLKSTSEYLLAEVNKIPQSTKSNSNIKLNNQKQKLITKHKLDSLLSLWLISRIAMEKKETTRFGQELSDRTLQVAKENLEKKWVLALMNENALRELKQGNKKAAEKSWSEMLDLILSAPNKKTNKVSKINNNRTPLKRLSNIPAGNQFYIPSISSISSILNTVIPYAGPRLMTVQVKAGTKSQSISTIINNSLNKLKPKKKKPKVSLITISQFEKAMKIAKIAANNQMFDLSLKAVSKSLSDGPPIITLNFNTNNFSGRSGIAQNEIQQNKIVSIVEKHISELNKLWKKNKFPQKQVTETLIQVVFPENRPSEIFLYQRPFRGSRKPSSLQVSSSHSIARILLEWATQSGELEQLGKIAENRQKETNLNIESMIFLTELALLKKDYHLVNKHFSKLNSLISKNTAKHINNLICQITFPTLKIQETSDSALKLVKQAISNLGKGTETEPVSSYLMILAVNQMLHQQEKEAYETLKQYLLTNTRMNTRYSGDYGFYLRKKQLANVTEILIHSSMFSETLDYLGELSDIKMTNYAQIPVSHIVANLARKLSIFSDKERYNFLSKWIFPNDKSNKFREISACTPIDEPPGLFFNNTQQKSSQKDSSENDSATSRNYFSSSLMLVETAKKLNLISELKDKLNKIPKEVKNNNIEIVNRLNLLILISEGDNKEAIKQLKTVNLDILASIPEVKITSQKYDSDKSHEFALVLACLNSPDLLEIGQELLKTLELNAFRFSARDMMVQTRFASYLYFSKNQKTNARSTTNIALWHPGSHKHSAIARGASLPVWVSQNEHISHITGPEVDYLFFKYPITGNFEFSVDTLNSRWAEGHIAYNGLTYQLEGMSRRGEVWGAGRHGSVILPAKTLKHNDFNNFAIQVNPKSVKKLVNQELFHEDKSPGTNSPWLSICSENACKAYFRNFKLTGNPIIPREVKMSAKDSLDGWIGSFHGEKIKVRKNVFENKGNSQTQRPVTNVIPTVWHAENGIIHGQKTENNPHFHSMQSWLYYNRPLLEKDIVKYEFFYEPGKIQTHPTIGRFALILAKDGVKLHWITDKQEYDWTGLFSDNITTVKDFQKGPSNIPLKSSDWNQIELTVGKTHIQLKLNKTLIYKLPIQYLTQNTFGLFHYKDLTESQVKNVVLTGDWPTELSKEQIANLISGNKNSKTDSKPIHSLIPEDIVNNHASDILAQSQKLSSENKYNFLKKWVLPNHEHSSIRLYPNTKEAPKESKSKTEKTPLKYLNSPAMELVKIANELGKTDDLISSLKNISLNDKNLLHARNALLVLIKVQQKKDQEAAELLATFSEHFKSVDEETPLWNRWPELVAIHEALNRPALKSQCKELVGLISVQPAPKKPVDYVGMRKPEIWLQALNSIVSEAEEAKK